MSLNWREIDLVLEETPLVNAHIQQVVQPDFRNLLFQMYQPGNPFWFLICLETGATRMHRWTGPVGKPRTRQRFAQLLHSRIRGGKIIGVSHVNHDRIVRMDVRRGGEVTTLWIRLWGGAANMIATDEAGTILDAFYRRPKREEISGSHFEVPEQPAESGAEKRDTKKAQFESRFRTDDGAPGNSVSEQIERHYAEQGESRERNDLLVSAGRILRQRRNRLEQQLERLHVRSQEIEPPDRLRLYGDLVMANLHRLQQGDRWLETQDYTSNDSAISIELDAGLSPGANAARFYERAKKSKRRSDAIAQEIRNLETRLGEAEAALTSIDEADPARLAAIVDEAEPEERQSGSEASTPGLRFLSGDFTILVGRNARENDQLLRRHVRGNDLWLHTRDYPGGYVFVRAQKGRTVPLDVLLDAGNLAVHFSKAKSNGRADLYYAQVKHLRRAGGGPLGLVLPTHEKNLDVVLDQDRLQRLLK